MIQIFKVVLLCFSFSAIAGSGVGGAIGGGGVKPELERIINLRTGGSIGGSGSPGDILERNTLNYEIIRNETPLTPSKLIQFNIDEVEEVTLKDGSVVKTYEILELMKK